MDAAIERVIEVMASMPDEGTAPVIAQAEAAMEADQLQRQQQQGGVQPGQDQVVPSSATSGATGDIPGVGDSAATSAVLMPCDDSTPPTAAGQAAEVQGSSIAEPAHASPPATAPRLTATSKKGQKKGVRAMTGTQTGVKQSTLPKQSRNKPCACGSGRKHKNCCAMVTPTEHKQQSLHQPADQVAVQLATLCI